MKKAMLALALVGVLFVVGCRRGPTYNVGMRKVTIVTEPSGAKVYQYGAMTRSPVLLGTSPVQDQPVSVITGAKGTMSGHSLERLINRINMVAVKIEKDGYLTWEGNLATDEKETKVHTITLEPEAETAEQ